MSNVQIFKFDGAIQGHPESQVNGVAAMRQQLVALIGDDAIVSMWKARLRIKPCPGMPSGSINVYMVTGLAWLTLERRDGESQGFRRLAGWHDRTDAAFNSSDLPRRLWHARPVHPLRVFSRCWAVAR